jgi:hypothetical protein
MSAGGDLGVTANAIMVIYTATCVEHHIIANDATRIYNHTRANHTSFANNDIGSNCSTRVNSTRESLSLQFQLGEEISPDSIISNCNDNGIVGDTRQL